MLTKVSQSAEDKYWPIHLFNMSEVVTHLFDMSEVVTFMETESRTMAVGRTESRVGDTAQQGRGSNFRRRRVFRRWTVVVHNTMNALHATKFYT